MHPRPAACAPGAGEGPKERGQGRWSCRAGAVWGKEVPQSLLWEGMHRENSSVVRPPAAPLESFLGQQWARASFKRDEVTFNLGIMLL